MFKFKVIYHSIVSFDTIEETFSANSIARANHIADMVTESKNTILYHDLFVMIDEQWIKVSSIEMLIDAELEYFAPEF